MKRQSAFPPGWNEERVRSVLSHYENQSDEEALIEDKVLEDGVREGWLTPAPEADSESPPPRKPVAPLRQILDELADDREE